MDNLEFSILFHQVSAVVLSSASLILMFLKDGGKNWKILCYTTNHQTPFIYLQRPKPLPHDHLLIFYEVFACIYEDAKRKPLYSSVGIAPR